MLEMQQGAKPANIPAFQSSCSSGDAAPSPRSGDKVRGMLDSGEGRGATGKGDISVKTGQTLGRAVASPLGKALPGRRTRLCESTVQGPKAGEGPVLLEWGIKGEELECAVYGAGTLEVTTRTADPEQGVSRVLKGRSGCLGEKRLLGGRESDEVAVVMIHE